MAEEKKKTVKKYVPGSRFCPKCGARMAIHSDRHTCGKCGYTEWKGPSK
ncbi:MAG: 30S ribosomal protein S27ae [Candidatus Micrarchaeota archaeon]|nr:30S ribosomal protein S27ae [Candidatus Micrarchaeota archaeon]MDE1849912.1 30S ribosomal protein S27ae [Candidatus Micrarchaeota archaeon]